MRKNLLEQNPQNTQNTQNLFKTDPPKHLPKPNVEYSSAKFHEKFENFQNLEQIVKLNELKKHFGDIKAVDGITF